MSIGVENLKEWFTTLIGTPADTDVSTDIANVSTDIANVQTAVDEYNTIISGDGLTVVEDSNTGTPSITPVTASASANTFGLWVEIDASTAQVGKLTSYSCVATGSHAAPQRKAVIEFGIGAALSETTIYRKSFSSQIIADDGTVTWQFVLGDVSIPDGIKIASGTRISCRVADSNGNGNFNISVQREIGI